MWLNALFLMFRNVYRTPNALHLFPVRYYFANLQSIQDTIVVLCLSVCKKWAFSGQHKANKPLATLCTRVLLPPSAFMPDDNVQTIELIKINHHY